MQKVNIQEVQVYENQVTSLQIEAQKLIIASPEENAQAIELKAKLDKTWKGIKAFKESITKPINEALKNARAVFAPIEAKYEEADRLVGKKLLAYKHEVEEETRKKEAQIAARVEKGTMRLDTAEKKLDSLERVEKTTHTAAGQVQFRQIPKMRITDENLIPEKYWIIDLVALRKDVLAGEVVPGAEKFYEEIV